MDLRQLRYFLQIVDCGSISRASEILRIAQPSLSLQLKALEEELNAELLVRHARGVTATDVGLLLCDHARKILREVDHAKEAVQSQAANPLGKVLIGIPTSACRGLTRPLVEATAEKLPGVSIHIIEAMTGGLDEWLRAGQLDVAVLYNRRVSEHVISQDILSENLGLIARTQDAENLPKTISFAETWSLPLVIPGPSNVFRTLVDELAIKKGLERASESITDCDSLPGILKMVSLGKYTILPSFAVNEEISRGDICSIPIHSPTPSWVLSVVQSKRTLNPRASEAVARVLTEVAGGLVHSGAWAATLLRGKPTTKKRR